MSTSLQIKQIHTLKNILGLDDDLFTEKYGMPHLIGKHPRGATKEETDNLADLLEQMVQDAIAVIPDDSSVEIQEANKSSSAAIYEQLIDKMNSFLLEYIVLMILLCRLKIYSEIKVYLKIF